MNRHQVKQHLLSNSGRYCFQLLVVVAMLLPLGCSRKFWRKQADKDVYRAVSQKQTDGRWQLPRTNIRPNPNSRFYDPYDPDEGPLPPDDPAAAQYMQCADGIPGYKSWHEFGRSLSIENPQWLSQFDLTPEMIDEETGEYTGQLPAIKELSLTDAIELSYIHSRDYQTQLENLYLAALDLTFDRFQFQIRYLTNGGSEPTVDAIGQVVPTSDGAKSANFGTRMGISQALPTGGQWAIEFANQTLWVFSGGNPSTSASLLSYRLVQPLLLGGGRRIALEGLTQSERSLLYQTRTLARFRKILFVDTVAGGGRGGFIGLLTQLQAIRNQEGNIRRLEEQVELLRANAAKPPGKLSEPLGNLPDGFKIPNALEGKLAFDNDRKLLNWYGAMSDEQAELLLSLNDDPEFQRAATELAQLLRSDTVTLDVAQLESSLRGSQIALESQKRAYQDSLDQYKIDLGLPPDIVVSSIDDKLLNQFQLIDQTLYDFEDRVDALVYETGQLDPQTSDLATVRDVLRQLYQLEQEIYRDGVSLLQADFARVESNLETRLANLESDVEREYVLKTFYKDRDRLTNAVSEFKALNGKILKVGEVLSPENVPQNQISLAIEKIQDLREELLKQAQSLEVIQIGLRVELIDVNRFTLTLQQSTGLAMENRLDLMNARAEVTDARRRQEVAANRLKAVLDVVVEGDVRTPVGRNRPFDFRGSNSDIRAGINFDTPLDQVAERNDYRAAQIDYQRARRDYMALEDQVKLEVRTAWRQLRVLERNLETARQALRFAALQYDQAVEESAAPAKPGQSNQGGVQGRNLLNALESVLRAQDSLIGIWADYERSRLNIYRDMAIMEVNPQGVWNDEFYLKLLSERFTPSDTTYPTTDEAGGDPAGREVPSRLPEPANLEGSLNDAEDPQNVSERRSQPKPAPLVDVALEPVTHEESSGDEAVGAAQPDPLGWTPGRSVLRRGRVLR